MPLIQRLIARTEGNPFFLEESVRTLVETGVLVGERGAYHLAQSLPTMQVPATVQGVLAARIDRLSPAPKRVLQTAAVIGTEVPVPLLQAIAELPEAAVHDSLLHIQAAEFVYETHLVPEHAYTFKHALTHEVAYGSLLPSGGGCCMHGSWRLVEAGAPTSWRTRSTAWRTMRCGARCGRKRWPTAGRPATKPWSARPIGKRWRISNRR